MSKTRFVIAAVALAGTLVAGLAQARSSSDVQWSVTIGSPVGVPVYTQPVPVYTQPVPVYSRPVPVYTRHVPVYTQPAPVVHCHYFVYRQRPEDRILAALVRKTDTIKRELGSLAQVIDARLTTSLPQGDRACDGRFPVGTGREPAARNPE